MPAWTKAVGVVVLVAGGVGAGMIVRGGGAGSSPPVAMRVTIAPQMGVTPSVTGTDIAALTISPDGRYVTFAANDAEGRPLLWLRALDGLEAKPLAGTENPESPFWSPDSRSIAFFSEKNLKKIDVGGGPAVTLTAVEDERRARSGSWNRDGVIIYAPDNESPIFRISANGGRPLPVTKLDPSKQETTHRWARFLPDGEHFLYTVGSSGHYAESELNAIYVASLDDPTPKLILRASSQAIYSEGNLLYVRGDALVAQRFDPAQLVVSGEASVVADGLHYNPAAFRGAFDVSESGTLFYVRARNTKSRLFWQDPDGRKTGPIGEPIQIWSGLAISPDAAKVAVGVMGQRTQSPDIWLYDAASGVGIPFAADPALFENAPVWSPDGTRIAFTTGGPVTELAVKPVAGGRATILLKSGGAYSLRPNSWSPDGASVVFERTAPDRNAKSEIWIVSWRGDPAPHRLIAGDANIFGGRISPDGRWILYTSDASGRNEVYVQAFPKEGPSYRASNGVITWGAMEGTGVWTQGGREIVYQGEDNKAHSVAIEVKNGTPVFGVPVERRDLAGVGFWWDIAPTGRVLVAIPDAEDNPTPLTVLTNWTAVLK
jgi:Tol biopolymer transport system component